MLRFSLNKPAWTNHADRCPLPPEPTLPLEYLRPGEWAEVRDVSGEPGWIARLAELGLRVGCRLRMIRAGSPCLVQIGGGRLSLRGDDALQVLVRPVVADA